MELAPAQGMWYIKPVSFCFSIWSLGVTSVSCRFFDGGANALGVKDSHERICDAREEGQTDITEALLGGGRGQGGGWEQRRNVIRKMAGSCGSCGGGRRRRRRRR